MKTLSILLLSTVMFAQVPLTDQRIIELTKSGLHQDELDRIIATAPSVSFDLSVGAEDRMTSAGVSEETIKQMAAREAGASLGTPTVAPVAAQPVKHSHKLRTWLIIGISAGALAYLGYQLSNPNETPSGCIVCGNGSGHLRAR